MHVARRLVLSLLVLAGTAGRAGAEPPVPSPEHTPEEVVGIVLRALATPDEPAPDAGIETTFRFASPANRAQTGPIERFKRLVKNPVYEPLLGHERAIRGNMRVSGDSAGERVRVIADDGTRADFAFVLTRQSEATDCPGCWMTDAVIRLQPGGQSL